MRIRWLLACSLAVCCLLSVGCWDSDTETGAGSKAPNEKTEASKDADKNFEAVKNALTNASESIKKAQTISSVKVSAKQPTNTNLRTGANPSPSPPEVVLDAEELKN